MLKKVELYSEILDEMSLKKPNRKALVCGKLSYTYKELKLAVDLFASDMIKLGVKQGDHVAIWSINSIQWVVAYFGIIRAGGVAVLLTFGMPTPNLEELAIFADVKYLVYGVTKETIINQDAALQFANDIGISGDCIYDIRQDYLARIKANESIVQLPTENLDSKRTATIIFTSGTTAFPKAVQQSQYAMCTNCISNWAHIGEHYSEKKMNALPLFHSFGLQILVAFLMKGATVWVMSELKPDVIVNTIIENEISDMTSVAALYHAILMHPRFKDEVAPVLRYCGVGGSLSSPQEMVRFYEAFPKANFICGYGQTEACTCITMHYPDDSVEKCAYTVGKTLSCVELKIIDLDGKQVENGKIGEVVVRTESRMNGYYKLSSNEECIDADEWMHTGDIGFLDEEEYLHITGRIKDIIIKNGENIAPSEVEDKILSCGRIREVKVIGIPHPVMGESIEACIIPEEGWDGEDTLRKQLKQKLSSFKTPEHFFVFKQFPLNENCKLNVQELKRLVIESIKSL